ncbi:hypothetical protein GUITHDRAFT_122507 [Guillardia theta CCMP2712]|uniref:Uncharacterized protein n=1 Tax=Guillardia theta (strain CCMP2712) TaxID=905079 RepID=L1I606_GUITC|nr:hypothetical protein GUITHDRAFT_122507 [Guillardia theta CCMP2712]EKX31294.1 hypothetical protein GUITHDRAFT_122507 [Guillardia theta CCMP2712]|eukprot:XP_005818274.1 hypothetical protein GUITHDRAFT_122507 [Guillardia theta CCMP2712]
MRCITFGKPLPGNIGFAHHCNNIIRWCSNFIAKGDNIQECFKEQEGISEFYEDTQSIIYDNDEVFVCQSNRDLIAHDPEYYSRCHKNLYRRKTQQQIPNLDETSASLAISRFFRNHVLKGSIRFQVSRVNSTRIISEWMNTAPFEEVTARLRVNWVILRMKKMLETIIYLTTRAKIRARIPSDTRNVERPNVRVFLAAFMIIARPESCFECIGRLERTVEDAAKRLVSTFKDICSRVEDSKSRPVTLYDWHSWICFLKQLDEYLDAFKAWKIPDENKLTERIKHALLAVYRAESHLHPDNEEYDSMKAEFESQKVKLRAKMLQMAGPQGLESFDESLVLQGLSSINVDTPPSVPAPESSSMNASGLSSLPGRMTNEQLAHELLLDPTFTLDVEGAGYIENPVLAKVRESFKVAFWDSLVDDLRLSPPCYIRVLRVIGEVRDGMIDLTPGRSKELKEKIDTLYWQEQIESGTIDWESCISLIRGMLGIAMEIQEPFRKKETQDRWNELEQELRASTPQDQPMSFCKALEYVLSRVNVMRVDAANTRLRSIAHVIQNHGIEYEQAHMNKKLKANPTYLKRTPEWIHEVIQKEIERGRTDLARLVRGEAKAYVDIHTASVLSLITGNEPVKTKDCPETLLLDLSRLHKFHADFHFDVLSACMLAMASQRMLMAMKNDVRVPRFLEHLKAVLNRFEASLVEKKEFVRSVVSTFESELSVDERELVVCCLPSSSKPMAYSSEMLERLIEVPQMVLEKSFLPIEEQWLRLISENGIKTENEIPQSPFVRNVYERILRNTKKMRNMVSLNRKVHFDKYNNMIASYSQQLCRSQKDADKEPQEDSSKKPRV